MAERMLYLFKQQQRKPLPDGYMGDEIINSLTGQHMLLERKTARRITGLIHTKEKGFIRRYREEGMLFLHIPDGKEEAKIHLLTLPDGRTRTLTGEIAGEIAKDLGAELIPYEGRDYFSDPENAPFVLEELRKELDV